jgi:hypothetical protein
MNGFQWKAWTRSPYSALNLIMVLKEWFKHAVHHLQVGELGPNQTADACRRLAEALANLFRQICTRPRAATGGIEDVVGEILRGGCRYSGFLFTSPYYKKGGQNPSLQCAISVAKQCQIISPRVQLMETWASVCLDYSKATLAEAMKTETIKLSELRLIANEHGRSMFEDLKQVKPQAVLRIASWLETFIQNPKLDKDLPLSAREAAGSHRCPCMYLL